MQKITTTETHKSPTGKPRYRVVVKCGSFVQGFPCLTAEEAAEIVRQLRENKQ